jgi:hypothetical protein
MHRQRVIVFCTTALCLLTSAFFLLFSTEAMTQIKSYLPYASASGKHALRRPMSAKHVPHVAIVGAGISGLRTAELLLQHGMKVTIFEARDRIGGRVSPAFLGAINAIADRNTGSPKFAEHRLISRSVCTPACSYP